MIRRIIAERTDLPLSVMGSLLRISEERKDIISLGPGEPDFVAPENVRSAAKRALDRGFTHYSSPRGREEFIELILKKLKKQNRISADYENVVVTNGSTEAILLGLMSTIDPGEGVLLPDPGFLAYKPSIEILNGLPLSVPLYYKEDFQFDVERMKEIIVPEKTRAIIINTPSNPTGTVLRKKVLEEIADFANEFGLLVISDEAYEKFVYGNEKHVSIGSLNGMEDRVLSLFTFSKSYAMPGFRIGYGVGPQSIIDAMVKLHVYSTLCVSPVSEFAAEEALRGPQGFVKKIVAEYDKRRRFMIKGLSRMDLPFAEPRGAFYVLPNIEEFRIKSYTFMQRCLKEAKVSVVPGVEFGRHGEGFIRLSYATSLPKIKTAFSRLERFIEKLRK